MAYGDPFKAGTMAFPKQTGGKSSGSVAIVFWVDLPKINGQALVACFVWNIDIHGIFRFLFSWDFENWVRKLSVEDVGCGKRQVRLRPGHEAFGGKNGGTLSSMILSLR